MRGVVASNPGVVGQANPVFRPTIRAFGFLSHQHPAEIFISARVISVRGRPMTDQAVRYDPVQSLITPPPGTAIAVSYLRVSTKEQAEKGGTDEGFSIPAQREANRRKAEQIGAVVVEEFVDAGESARKADRPALKRMIKYVKQHHVAYCIVHKVDRLARNRADDVTIHLALQEAGVMLVSATENIDETPSGMLLHGIMSTIAEFYSRNLATEVVKGMTQKASSGGTVGKAPIGYINVRVRDEVGREIRTVEFDTERAPLVEWAFKAYASGDWTVSQLHDELTSRGLCTLPTPRRPSKSLAVSSVHRMLTNPYYKGDIIYRGVAYRGSHEPLIPAEVWYQVQSVLGSHKTAADATQVHDHYLKGTVYCGQCGSRLIVNHAKNSYDMIYPYFICAGRHAKRTDCTRQAIRIEAIEQKIEHYYTQVEITPAQRSLIRDLIQHKFDELLAGDSEELQQLTAKRDKLTREQDKLLQAHYADAIPLSVLKREQDRILGNLDQINLRIDAHNDEYVDTNNTLEDSLNLLGDCAGIYERCDDANRRLMNQAFFTKIYIDRGGEVRFEPTPPYEMLLSDQIHEEAAEYASTTEKGNKVPTSTTDSLGQSWNLERWVPPAGFEPATVGLEGRCSIH